MSDPRLDRMATARFGVFGLAVMGQNLARNIAHQGMPVALYNRTAARTDRMVDLYGSEGTFLPSHDVAGFVRSIERPRSVLLMVKAGEPVDDAIQEVLPHLESGDMLIDGGNSYFQDTRRRTREVEATGFRYMGTGVSGGEEGARPGLVDDARRGGRAARGTTTWRRSSPRSPRRSTGGPASRTAGPAAPATT